MDELEIYFSYLTPDAQKKVLDFYKLKNESDLNFDIYPVFTLLKEKEER